MRIVKENNSEVTSVLSIATGTITSDVDRNWTPAKYLPTPKSGGQSLHHFARIFSGILRF